MKYLSRTRYRRALLSLTTLPPRSNTRFVLPESRVVWVDEVCNGCKELETHDLL